MTGTYERALGLASDACGLAVRFDGRCGYVHFAGLPPLCFVDDPAWLHDRAGDPACAGDGAGAGAGDAVLADARGRAAADRLRADPGRRGRRLRPALSRHGRLAPWLGRGQVGGGVLSGKRQISRTTQVGQAGRRAMQT